MTDSNREHGFYWIRLRGDFPEMPHRWIVAEWEGSGWIVAGLTNPVPPDLVAVVDDVTLRSPTQRYARLIPQPMRTPAPTRMPGAMQKALDSLDEVLSGRPVVRRA